MTRDFLVTRDVADVWTKARDESDFSPRRLRRPPISPETVREYVRRSTPAPPGTPPNRYQNNPMPMPAHLDSQRLVWVPAPGQTIDDLRQALRDWFLDRNTYRPPVASGPLKFFTVDDVARIWTEERQKAEDAAARADNRDPAEVPPISTNTVRAYVWYSQPAPKGKPPKRYQDNPVPPTAMLGTRRMVWTPGPGQTLADVEQALRDWYNDPARPGKGAGGGRKPAKKTRRRTR